MKILNIKVLNIKYKCLNNLFDCWGYKYSVNNKNSNIQRTKTNTCKQNEVKGQQLHVRTCT